MHSYMDIYLIGIIKDMDCWCMNVTLYRLFMFYIGYICLLGFWDMSIKKIKLINLEAIFKPPKKHDGLATPQTS